jgi:hypothetical protein
MSALREYRPIKCQIIKQLLISLFRGSQDFKLHVYDTKKCSLMEQIGGVDMRQFKFKKIEQHSGRSFFYQRQQVIFINIKRLNEIGLHCL